VTKSVYLLDNNVVKELNGATPESNVMNWLNSVDDVDIYIAVTVILEQRKGIEVARKKRNADLKELLAGEQRLRRLISEYWDKFLHIDNEIAEEWGRLYGERQADLIDLLVSASANVRDFTVVTRNVNHFKGRTKRIIDPFKYKKPPHTKVRDPIR
jgi:predicted nucleic acid-binding protein